MREQAAPFIPTLKHTLVRSVFCIPDIREMVQWCERFSADLAHHLVRILGAVLDCAVADITPLCPQFRYAYAHQTVVSLVFFWDRCQVLVLRHG